MDTVSIESEALAGSESASVVNAVSTVLVVHATPDALGGTERAMQLAVAEQRRRGARLILLHGQTTLSDEVSALFHGTISRPALFHRPSPGSAVAWGRNVRELRRDVGEWSIDVAHCHLWGHWLLLWVLRRLVPTVATTSLAVCPNGARFRFGAEQPCERAIGRDCLRWGHATQGCGQTADEVAFSRAAMLVAIAETKAELRELRLLRQVIAPSTWQRGRLVQDGIDGRMITVVAPPVVPTGGAVRRVGTPPRVAVACRLVRSKGVHRLIEASADPQFDHVLDVVGAGPARQALEAQVRELGLVDRVVFHGRLDPDETAQVLRDATVVAMPSLAPETFGMSGAEASAGGTTVLAVHHAGVKDWLRPEHGNVAVDDGTMGSLVGGLQAALSRQGSTGREAARAFDVAHHVDALDRVYAGALDRSAAAR